MRAYTQPLIVSGFGGADQSCQALEKVALRSGHGGLLYDEGWLQTLIQRHPALLPISDIEPALDHPVPICVELAVPSGYIDNLMLTPDGGVIVVETKLWRNPEARREVVGQVLDYAKDLARFDYEDLQRAVRAARREPEVRLFDLVGAGSVDLDERRFIDAVSRNLRLGRFLLVIAGDGVQENAEHLVSYLQCHMGLHFTLSLVEMSLWRDPVDGRVLVQPRILARTVQIERAVVRVETGVALATANVEPASPGVKRATTLSEEQFYEALGAVSPTLPGQLKAFLADTADLGVFGDVRKNLSLKWRSPQGGEFHLGSIGVSGWLDTEYCNWSTNDMGRLDLSHAYLADVAAIVPGGKVRETKMPMAWRAVTDRGELQLGDVLAHRDAWIQAIIVYVERLKAALQDQET